MADKGEIMYTRKVINELNALSKEVFGSSSRWKKIVERGVPELMTEEITEYVPDENGGEGTTRQVTRPIKRHDGANQSIVKRHTVESVRELMLKRRVEIAEVMAKIQQAQKEEEEKKAAQELAKKVQEQAGGAAV